MPPATHSPLPVPPKPRSARQRLPIVAVGCALLLSACAGGGGFDQRPRGNTELERALADLADPAAPVRLSSAPGSRRELNGALLNGLDIPGVEAVLGEPKRKRLDPPAQVWLYERPRCFVDLFLFDEGRGPQVIFVQERTREVKKIPAGRCLGEVWKLHRDKQ